MGGEKKVTDLMATEYNRCHYGTQVNREITFHRQIHKYNYRDKATNPGGRGITKHFVIYENERTPKKSH